MKVSELMALLAKCPPNAEVGYGNLSLTGEFCEPIEKVYDFGDANKNGSVVIYLDPGEKHADNIEVVFPGFDLDDPSGIDKMRNWEAGREVK